MPNEIPVFFLWKNDLKYTCKGKRPEIAKRVLKKEKKFGSSTQLDYTIIYVAIVTKPVWYGGKDA